MWAAILRRRAAARPTTSRNGTGAIGRPSVWEWTTLCLRWRCRAARCMRAVGSRWRAATRPIPLRNGTGAVGRPSVRGFQVRTPIETAPMCGRWRCRTAHCMRAAISQRRATSRPPTLPNGMGTVGSALGSGISGDDPYDYFYYVTALAVSGGTLYAGGVFDTADGVA